MSVPQQQWILAQTGQPPESFIQAVKQYAPASGGHFAAQLLWQRGIQDEATLAAFVSPQAYQSASPFEFGQEMYLAVQRLEPLGKTTNKLLFGVTLMQTVLPPLLFYGMGWDNFLPKTSN